MMLLLLLLLLPSIYLYRQRFFSRVKCGKQMSEIDTMPDEGARCPTKGTRDNLLARCGAQLATNIS